MVVQERPYPSPPSHPPSPSPFQSFPLADRGQLHADDAGPPPPLPLSTHLLSSPLICILQTVGKYMVEVWKAVGMDLTHVEFLNSSEEINKRPDEYWTLVMDIARKSSLKRVVR